MFLSRLAIDISNDPTRERPGRLWLRNLYRVHQRLCMAFPSAELRSKIEEDPRHRYFLQPYAPEDFPEGRHLADRPRAEVGEELLEQVHSPRSAGSGFLFRIDPLPGGRAVILVQSAAKPDWQYAFQNAGYLLAALPQLRPFSVSFEAGQRLRYRLLANPTRRLTARSPGADQQPVRKWANEGETRKDKPKGMRVPVPVSQFFDWLARKGQASGFSVSSADTTIQPGYVYVGKGGNGGGHRLRSVRYDGVLTVHDPARLREATVEGIGPGKAFGFGLLSVAPCGVLPAQEAV